MLNEKTEAFVRSEKTLLADKKNPKENSSGFKDWFNIYYSASSSIVTSANPSATVTVASA